MNRKVLKRNLILMLAAAGVLLVTAVVCYFLGRIAADGLKEIKAGIDERLMSPEIGDVEGYGILVSGTGYLLGGLAYLVFVVFFVVIPAFFGVWLLVFTLLAWIVAIKTENLLVYRILMGFDFAGVALMMLLNLLALAGGSVFMLSVTACWGAVLFFGIRNTYTKRIRQDILKTSSERQK